jgi:Protein of unknown function (DUF2793)
MPDQTSRIGMPYMASAQAQKELVHNEAITLADLMIQPVVQEIGANAPPLSPEEGACWVVGTSPSGAWASHAGKIAGWTSGGWRFVSLRNGFSVWSIADSKSAHYIGGQWVLGVTNATEYRVNGQHVLKERQPIIPDPVGGATIDAEGRITLVSILQALRTHGLIAI